MREMLCGYERRHALAHLVLARKMTHQNMRGECEGRVIRSVVVPRMAASDEELSRVKALMEELGFREGKGWNDRWSRGVPMMTNLGVLEFYHGQPPAAAEVIVEVDDLSRTLELVKRHKMKVLADVSRTHWGADLFVAEIGGCHVAFFAWAEPKEEWLPKVA